MKKGLMASLIVSFALVFGSSAFAGKDYDGGAPGAGSISGVVSLKGNPPAPIMEDLNKGKNSEFCATHPDAKEGGIRPRYKVVAPGGKLSGTVVFIEEIAKGKDWGKGTNFDFKTCDVFPKVAAIWKTPKGVKEGVAMVTNHDPNILHNPHGYSVVGANRKTLFNKPLPNQGDVADVTASIKRLKEGKDQHFFLQCDQHNFMEADARIVYNPYFSVSGDDGSFKIDGIPAGTYKVTAWHPYIGEVTKDVTVGGGDTKQDFELAAK